MGFFDRFRKTIPTPSPAKGAGVRVTPKAAAKKEVKEKEKEQVGAVQAQGVSELAARLLLKPHVSEKAAHLAEGGTYSFDVAIDAEKIAIKKAVEALYKVKVEVVRTVRHAGKPIYRGRRPGARNRWKKALVTLQKGQTISLYEGV